MNSTAGLCRVQAPLEQGAVKTARGPIEEQELEQEQRAGLTDGLDRLVQPVGQDLPPRRRQFEDGARPTHRR